MDQLQGSFEGEGELFTGTVSPLGSFSGVIDNSVQPPTAVWTAENGEQLTNRTTSFVIDDSAPVAPNVCPYTQTIEITGGNGRFANASGSATITGTINVVTFAYNGRIDGALSCP